MRKLAMQLSKSTDQLCETIEESTERLVQAAGRVKAQVKRCADALEASVEGEE